jgi:hypothetical protein
VSEIEICQDHEFDDAAGIGGPLPVFWAKGHGFDDRAFIRAVLDYCLDNHVDIPAITMNDAPVETWQQNVARSGSIEYQRDSSPPTSSRSPRFPITLLDLDRRGHGGTRCAVTGCDEPWSTGAPVRVCVEPGSGEAELGAPYMAVCLWLCREHRKHLPEPLYRVCLVPVGATILLPADATTCRADELDPQGGQ